LGKFVKSAANCARAKAFVASAIVRMSRTIVVGPKKAAQGIFCLFFCKKFSAL